MLRKAELPDPDQMSDSDVVIFDGQCNFCRSQVSNLHWLDRFGKRLSFISLHDPRVAEWYPELTYDQMMEQMFVVDRQGRRYGGGDAIKFLSRRLPLMWIAAPVLHIPGTTGIWRWLYKQVAKRRYKLAGKAGDASSTDGCENDACSVHLK